MQSASQSHDNVHVRKILQDFLAHIEAKQSYFIGFPATRGFDYRELYPTLDYLLNNVGDPFTMPLHANHSKAIEQEVVTFFADLFRAPLDDRWGYVTNGGSEGNLYALYVAREMYPRARVYYSNSTHYSVPKNIHILGMAGSPVAVQPNGEMDYADLRRVMSQHTDVPAVIVATVGSTMSESRDDVAAIKHIAQELGMSHFIHSDAALTGIYAPFMLPRPAFDMADGADSISLSGHKFLGSPLPCGVVITRRSARDSVTRSAVYAGGLDTTISGSRSGHTPLFLWYALQQLGKNGIQQRLKTAWRCAEYTEDALRSIGWKAWRYPQALTVMIASPPPELIHKWQLATYDGWSHVICMPGVSDEQIDNFVADLKSVIDYDT